jgi:hypothetical protein
MTAELRARLEKKATFEAALRELSELCASSPGDQQWGELYPLVARSHQLLKTRYTNPNFHRLGERLFSACLVRPLQPRNAPVSSPDPVIQTTPPALLPPPVRRLQPVG